MNRSEKEAFVTHLTEGIGQAQALALMSFSRLNVEQMTAFRLSLSKRNVKVKVVKNTLAKRVFDQSPYKEVAQHLDGPTMLVYSPADPVATVKAMWEWADKENFNLKIKAGAALGQIMTELQLKALSKLPGKNEMFVGFLWALKSGPTRFLYALQDAPRRMAYALDALKAKKEKEST